MVSMPAEKESLRQVCAKKGRLGEIGEVKHWSRLPLFDDNEESEQHERPCQFAKDPAVGPAAMVALDERERGQEQGAAETGDAGEVEALGMRVPSTTQSLLTISTINAMPIGRLT